jgi:hypothetical protein
MDLGLERQSLSLNSRMFLFDPEEGYSILDGHFVKKTYNLGCTPYGGISFHRKSYTPARQGRGEDDDDNEDEDPEAESEEQEAFHGPIHGWNRVMLVLGDAEKKKQPNL